MCTYVFKNNQCVFGPTHRYVGTERGPEIYYPQNCQAGPDKCASFEPIGQIVVDTSLFLLTFSPFPSTGYIPQVNNTFAYWEETYGTMNEKQVAISESTCSGVFTAARSTRPLTPY